MGKESSLEIKMGDCAVGVHSHRNARICSDRTCRRIREHEGNQEGRVSGIPKRKKFEKRQTVQQGNGNRRVKISSELNYKN